MILRFRRVGDIVAVAPQVREHLAHEGLLGYPTETVYGLGSAPGAAAVSALGRLKGRPGWQPFLLLVAGLPMAEEWGLRFNPVARQLADRFWPGPLTLVLPGGDDRLAGELRGPTGGIAVRHSAHAAITGLIALLEMPITSTSANRSGAPPITSATELSLLFPEEVEGGRLLILDGGVIPPRPPSTLIDCVVAEPRLLREGAVPRAEIERVLGRPLL
jgi:L-threonylcarbamoyladenylate synthase